ncbi:MAG: NmrA-like protein [Sphingomonas bacterium]|nr:NmrA-like protein [Sphingomonas bacterium]
MAVIVSGASGELGAMTVAALAERVDPRELILVTREPERLAHWRDRGADIRQGDLDAPETLARAYAGGDRLLLISTAAVGPMRQRQHRVAIDAAAAAGVPHIVYTSSAAIHPRNPCFVIPDHIATERMLADSGLAVTILRVNSYADILVHAIAPQAIATGRWIAAAGEGAVGFVAKRDVARAAAAALTDDSHAGAIYEITGPELLTSRDAARIAAEISGCPIELIIPEDAPVPGIAAAEQEQASEWIGPFTMADLQSFDRAVRAGYYAVCTHHVEMITGAPATSLRTLFEAAADARRAA